MHDLSRQVVSTLQHLLRLDPGCRLVDFGAGACKLASQLYRSKIDLYLLYGVKEKEVGKMNIKVSKNIFSGTED